MRQILLAVALLSLLTGPARAEPIEKAVWLCRGLSLPPVVTLTGRIVDRASRPVAGADLMLWTNADGPEGKGSSSSRRLQASSDARGRFRFEHVGRGSYQMSIRSRGFAPAWREGIAGKGIQGTVDIGDLPLETGAVIEGLVTDPDGTPLAGAQVRVSCCDRSSLRRQLFDPEPEPLLTGADGSFRIADLEGRRSFSLRISRSGYVPASAPGVEAPTAEPLRIELRPARSLSLRVLDPQRRPVAGARVSQVELRETGAGKASSSSWSAIGLGETDEEGRAVLSEMEPGELRLLVRAQGYRPAELAGLRIPEEGEPEPLEVLLEPGVVLEGRVLDGRGEPMARAQMRVFPPDPGSRPRPMLSALTEEDGRYRFDGLGPGEHQVEAEHWPSQRHAQGEIVLGESGTYRLDLRLPAGVAVSGQVLGETGEPLSGAWVTLTRESSSEPDLPASSSSGGAFRFEAVPDGLYRLRAGSRDHRLATEPDLVSVAGREIEGLVVRLERGAAITGRILGVAREDLDRLRLAARSEHGEPSAGAGLTAEGVYRLSPLIPGTWQVTATLASGLSVTGTVRVEAGEEAVLDLEMPRGIALSGRVLVDGQPLSGAQVSSFLPMGSSRKLARGPGTTTRYDGSFALRGLRPGRLDLGVFARGIFHSESLDLTADREITIEILTGGLSGHVLSSTGEPVAGAAVSLRGEDDRSGIWSQAAQANADKTGAFEVPRLAAGSYRITAGAKGFGPASHTVVVTPGGTAEIRVVLEPETRP
jgi:protocatechuate 3,4-dioxygenase beta subunit